MRIKITIILLFAFKLSVSQTYTWAASDNNYQQSEGVCLAKDQSGNILSAVSYTQPGTRNGIKILKYDSLHNLLWTQKIEGGVNSYKFFGLATDLYNNVYFTGVFTDSLFVNGITELNGNGNGVMMLIKYNSQGVFQWLRRATGNCSSGIKLTTDFNNNVYVAGNLTGNNNFNGIATSGPSHNYIAKYNSNGQIQWVRQTGGGSNPYWGLGLKTDGAGNSFLAGSFTTWASFGTYTLNATTGYPYATDPYIAKIDSSGNWLWAINATGNGGSFQAGLADLEMDAIGNLYICGFTGYATTNFGTVTVTNTGEDDWYLAKYDPNGNCIWAKSGGGAGSQFAYGLCVGNSGQIYMARSGAFFSKFDGSGNYLFSQFKSGTNNCKMVKDSQGSIYFTGAYTSPVSFDSYSLTISSGSSYQMYIVRLSDPSTPTGIKGILQDNSINIFPNPASQHVTITCQPMQSYFIKISNSVGQTVYTEFLNETNSSSKEINISHLAKGLYVIELINPNSKDIIRAKKLVIE